MLSARNVLGRVNRVLRKPASYIALRIAIEIRNWTDRLTQPRFGRRFDERALLKRTGSGSIDALWNRLVHEAPWPLAERHELPSLADIPEDEREEIVAAGGRAIRHVVDLLGSGPITLGDTIDWHRDFKTGDRWPVDPSGTIDYVNRERGSDVKHVWELSRLQWLIPAGQAYVLTTDERYAAGVRNILESWMQSNPYALGVNWSVAMEPALRIVTWLWLLRVFGSSRAWGDRAFRTGFLRYLYLHVLYTERYIERSDICGNHFTAEAAALVVAGAVFRGGADADRWLANGLRDLEHEIQRQVHPDGVDFEASIAYHRLVVELFLFGAMFARSSGCGVSERYEIRLRRMAEFTAAYSRPDGLSPLFGDADDARVLPLGRQPMNDHRYLISLVALYLSDPVLSARADCDRSEVRWVFGQQRSKQLSSKNVRRATVAFPKGGFFVLQSDVDHVFVDCGPLGLAGRGGHDHNDMLSFEAVLAGKPLVSDRGAYVYTGSFSRRNEFRATASHNTPQIDDQELNRISNPGWLWHLENDAHPVGATLVSGDSIIRFSGSHDGYSRLDGGPVVHRVIELSPSEHALVVRDRFSGAGVHSVKVPLHLAPQVTVEEREGALLLVKSGGVVFEISWVGAPEWRFVIEDTSVSPSYGVEIPTKRFIWSARGPIEEIALDVRIRPSSAQAGDAE